MPLPHARRISSLAHLEPADDIFGDITQEIDRQPLCGSIFVGQSKATTNRVTLKENRVSLATMSATTTTTTAPPQSTVTVTTTGCEDVTVGDLCDRLSGVTIDTTTLSAADKQRMRNVTKTTAFNNMAAANHGLFGVEIDEGSGEFAIVGTPCEGTSLGSQDAYDIQETATALIALWGRHQNKLKAFGTLLDEALAADELCSRLITEHNKLSGNKIMTVPSTTVQQRVHDMQETVKRRFGDASALQAQLELACKKRRKNLTDESIGIMQVWFDAHEKNPYPTIEEKDKIAKDAGVTPGQVSNWFINTRKRRWRQFDEKHARPSNKEKQALKDKHDQRRSDEFRLN